MLIPLGFPFVFHNCLRHIRLRNLRVALGILSSGHPSSGSFLGFENRKDHFPLYVLLAPAVKESRSFFKTLLVSTLYHTQIFMKI